MHTDYRSPAPVALTFDDGPDPIWTPLVFDALASVGVRATFFVVAPRAARYPSLISSMRERGHDVAFHCVEHVRHDAEGDRNRRRLRTPGAGTGRAVLESALGPHLEPLTALEDEHLERVLCYHDVPIHRLLSVRVMTSPRLVGRATRGLSNDLAKTARNLREEREQG